MPTLDLPETYERVLFIGENGSGKTYLAEQMLAYYDRWIAVDLKGDLKPPCDFTILRTPEDRRWSGPWRPEKILYRPRVGYNNGPWHNEVLRAIYARAQKEGKRKPFILYLDEGLMMSKLGDTTWLESLIVAGRSLQVGVWISSQRPRHIPVEIRSEAWRWYIFALGYKADEKEVIQYSKGQVTEFDLQRLDGDYSFYEIRRTKGGKKHVRKMPPLVRALPESVH